MARTLEVPLFPLPQVTLFPGVRVPFYVFEPRYKTMLAEVLDGPGYLGIPMLLPGYEQSEGDRPPISRVFGVGRVGDYQTHEDGTSHVLVVGTYRVALLEELPSEAFRRARVEILEEVPATEDEAGSLRIELQQRIERLVELGMQEEAREAFDEILSDPERDPGFLVNLLATVVVGNAQVRQNLLEVDEIAVRGQHLLTILDTQTQMWSPDYTGTDPDLEDES